MRLSTGCVTKENRKDARFRGVRTSGLIGLLTVWWLVQSVSMAAAEADPASMQQPQFARETKAPRSLPWRQIPAHGVLLKDLNTGRTLYEFGASKRLSPASLTKIMSALVILEYGNLDDQVVVSSRAARAHKIRLGLKAGQVFRLEDLLKAMLIVSANDACLAAVEHVGGDEEQFVLLMNAKARALGLTDTHFNNGCGFDAPDHYSTAEDLAKLSEIALQHPVFKQLVRMEREIIIPVNGNRPYLLRNTNRLLGTVPGVEGVKTGFTSKAGRCLVAKVSQDGRDLLLVLLNAKRRWTTALSLIRFGLHALDGGPNTLR